MIKVGDFVQVKGFAGASVIDRIYSVDAEGEECTSKNEVYKMMEVSWHRDGKSWVYLHEEGITWNYLGRNN